MTKSIKSIIENCHLESSKSYNGNNIRFYLIYYKLIILKELKIYEEVRNKQKKVLEIYRYLREIKIQIQKFERDKDKDINIDI